MRLGRPQNRSPAPKGELMNLAEFNTFTQSHQNGLYICDLSANENRPCRSFRSHGSVKFTNVLVSGNARSISFTNPVSSLVLSGVIHIQKIDGERGAVHFTITCKDDYKGEQYDEKILWIPTP